MVEPLGEARDIREIFPELARRIGGGMEKEWFASHTVEEYMAEWTRNVPFDEKKYKSPMDMLADVGAFEDPDEPAYYAPYLKPLSEEQMKGAVVDPKTGIITRDGKGIGIMHWGKPVVGFKTPSRRFEVRSDFLVKVAKNEDATELIDLANSRERNRPEHHAPYNYDLDPWPRYMQIVEHAELEDDQLIMTFFKWCVHNHGRTARSSSPTLRGSTPRRRRSSACPTATGSRSPPTDPNPSTGTCRGSSSARASWPANCASPSC
jgi:anaerobic selenocysteine-containing dehydrogenase